MHFFEITDPEFLLELSDYLPREAYNKSHYLLFTSKVNGKTFLVTSITLLQQVMDGFAMRGHCKRITRKKMESLNNSHDPSRINIIAGTDFLARMQA
jgi:hypothetical protein